MGKLKLRSETFAANGTSYILNPYRNFESYTGMYQSYDFPSSGSSNDVYYLPISATNFQTYAIEFYYPTITSTYDGIKVMDYTLGTSSASTPKRHELIRSDRYDGNMTIYFIPACIPGDKSEGWNLPIDEHNNVINFKYKAWIGWKQGHTGSTNYDNPFFNASTLSAIKTTLTSPNPTQQAESYSFGHFYMRYSTNGIAGLTSWSGSSASSNAQAASVMNYAYNGIKNRAVWCTYNGDGYTSSGITGANHGAWIIPGDENDNTDSNCYYIYGYLATSKKLQPNSFMNFSDYSQTMRIYVSYIDDDGIPWLSSGQSYASNSGFLNFGSYSNRLQDYNDGLRYIYKFMKVFNSGFSNTPDGALMINGPTNNITQLHIRKIWSLVPHPSIDYRFEFRYSIQILNSSNTVVASHTSSWYNKTVYRNNGGVYGEESWFVNGVYYSSSLNYRLRIVYVEWRYFTSPTATNASATGTLGSNTTFNITSAGPFMSLNMDPPTPNLSYG